MHPLGTLEGGLEGFDGLSVPAADIAVQAATAEFPSMGKLNAVLVIRLVMGEVNMSRSWLLQQRKGNG